MRMLCRPHPRMHTCTHAARTHARERCVQALDEITPLETKKAKIERDLHKEHERADKFRGACARVNQRCTLQSIASVAMAADAEEARTVYEAARDSVLREIPEVTTAAQRSGTRSHSTLLGVRHGRVAPNPSTAAGCALISRISLAWRGVAWRGVAWRSG